MLCKENGVSDLIFLFSFFKKKNLVDLLGLGIVAQQEEFKAILSAVWYLKLLKRHRIWTSSASLSFSKMASEIFTNLLK